MEAEDRQEQRQQGDMQKQLMQHEVDRRRQSINQLPNKQCLWSDSMDTKFSYFNNINLSWERYLCRRCKRHWIHGGALRNLSEGSAVPKPRPPRASISLGLEGGLYKITMVDLLDNYFNTTLLKAKLMNHTSLKHWYLLATFKETYRLITRKTSRNASSPTSIV